MTKDISAYDEPLYYEVAFSFIDSKKQIDFFEKISNKWGVNKINHFLDVACGPSIQAEEILKRGYKVTLVDLNSKMIKYVKKKYPQAESITANMKKFKINKKADFAFIMMGSLSYVGKSEDLFEHLNFMGKNLNKGGLYFIENYRLDYNPKVLFSSSSWTMKKGNIKVKTTYKIEKLNMLNQELLEKMKLEVNDNGKKRIIEEKVVTTQIFPQQFKFIVEKQGDFELLGFYKHFKLNKLKEVSQFNHILLRKK